MFEIEATVIMSTVAFCCACSNGTELVSVYGVVGCMLFRGFQCIEVYGEVIGTFKIVRYIVDVRR